MMLSFYRETSGTALGGNEPLSRSHMRDGASRNTAIQLRADPPRLLVPVAPSRVEETTVHPFLSACCSALIDIAAVLATVLLITATGIGIVFAGFILMFCSL